MLRYHNRSHSRNSGAIYLDSSRSHVSVPYRLRCVGKSKSAPLTGISASMHKASAASLSCCRTRVGTSYRRFYGTESKRLPMPRYVISIWRRQSTAGNMSRRDMGKLAWLAKTWMYVCMYVMYLYGCIVDIRGFLDIVSVTGFRNIHTRLRSSCKYLSRPQKTARGRLRRSCWISGLRYAESW